MDAISVSMVTDPVPAVSVPTSGNSQPVINPAPVQLPVADHLELSSEAAQLQAPQPRVQYANPEVLGTNAVTTYMVNGQLYTRIRDENTNKVTYLPNEAQVLPPGNDLADMSPILNITA